MADIGDTTAPKSDQMDAIDLVGGPRVFTVATATVKKGAEQPVAIHMVEFDRPWMPGVTMRRVLVACWGNKSADYAGRRVKLWRDPKVVWGGQEVGGIRIAALSHINGRQTVPTLLSQGRAGVYIVEPLSDEPPAAPLVADDQTRRLAALIRESGIGREEAMPLFSSWIGREITATKEMTPAETAVVIGQLSAMNDGPNIPAT